MLPTWHDIWDHYFYGYTFGKIAEKDMDDLGRWMLDFPLVYLYVVYIYIYRDMCTYVYIHIYIVIVVWLSIEITCSLGRCNVLNILPILLHVEHPTSPVSLRFVTFSVSPDANAKHFGSHPQAFSGMVPLAAGLQGSFLRLFLDFTNISEDFI